MLHQNWVLPSPVRSVQDEPSALEDNRRRILGSTLFPRDSPRQPRFPNPPQQPQDAAPLGQQLKSEHHAPSFVSTSPVSFPDLDFAAPQTMSNFALTFKPRQLLRNSQNHRLTVPPNHEMKRLREDLNRETEQYVRRLRQLGLV
jgi:hypothetical protein